MECFRTYLQLKEGASDEFIIQNEMLVATAQLDHQHNEARDEEKMRKDEKLKLKEDASVGWCVDEVLKLEQVASLGRFLVVNH